MSSEPSGFDRRRWAPSPQASSPAVAGKKCRNQMLRVAAEADMEALTYPQRERCAVVEV
jgi:hypothetical protein